MSKYPKKLEEILKNLYVFQAFLAQKTISIDQRILYEKHYTFNIQRIEKVCPIEYSFHAIWYDNYFCHRVGIAPYHDTKYLTEKK